METSYGMDSTSHNVPEHTQDLSGAVVADVSLVLLLDVRSLLVITPPLCEPTIVCQQPPVTCALR